MIVPLYTRQGDDGLTYCLFMGKRIPKDHPVFEFLGSLDELNSLLGMAYELCKIEDIDYLQRLVFRVGFSLNGLKVSEEDVRRLEEMVDSYYKPVQGFVLPRGSLCSAALHTARAVCRRAERSLVRLGREEKLEGFDILLKVMNRLSDALFALAVYTANRVDYMGEG